MDGDECYNSIMLRIATLCSHQINMLVSWTRQFHNIYTMFRKKSGTLYLWS